VELWIRAAPCKGRQLIRGSHRWEWNFQTCCLEGESLAKV
jgi:hypothetical protein